MSKVATVHPPIFGAVQLRIFKPSSRLNGRSIIHLLHSFFNKMDEILSLIECNAGTIELSTNLARQMIDHCTATIYCYGESGSEIDTNPRVDENPAAVTSHTVPGTEFDTHCIFKSGLRFIDAAFGCPLCTLPSASSTASGSRNIYSGNDCWAVFGSVWTVNRPTDRPCIRLRCHLSRSCSFRSA